MFHPHRQVGVPKRRHIKFRRLRITQKKTHNSQQDATVYQNLLFHVYINLNMFRGTHRPSSEAQNWTSSLWFCIRQRLLDVEVVGRCSATSASNNLSRMQNQSLIVQFLASDDERCVARNMLSFI